MPPYTESTTIFPTNSTPTGFSSSPSDCPHCLNGGTYVGGYCQCLAGYSGVYCEQAIYSTPGMYGKGHMCMFACIGVLMSRVYSLSLSPIHSLPPLFSLPLFFSPLSHPPSPSLLHSLSHTLTPVHTCPTDLVYPCGECYNGTCDYASATCVCHPLYEGERCDSLTSE